MTENHELSNGIHACVDVTASNNEYSGTLNRVDLSIRTSTAEN